VFGFDSVYVSMADGDGAALARAKGLLTQLMAGGDASRLGDAISLPRAMDDATQQAIHR
jgi:hypothetical protein